MTKTRKVSVVFLSTLLALLAIGMLTFSVSASPSAHPTVSSMHSLAKNICTGRPTSKISGASGSETITPPTLTNHGLGKNHAACIINMTTQNETLTYQGKAFCGPMKPKSGCAVYITKPPYGTATFGLLAPANPNATWTVTFAK